MKTGAGSGARGFNREWLRRKAEAEDAYPSVAVGGLAHEVGFLSPSNPEMSHVFGRFLELARRNKGMSVEQLSRTADVDLAELVHMELGEGVPSLRSIHKLSEALGVATESLLSLSGLTEIRDPEISDAAVRFAARSGSTARLSKEEKRALDELVKALAERSDRG